MAERKETLWGRLRGPRVGSAVAALALAVGASGCGDLFDVQNPNELVQEDIEKPTAVTALVNGAEATVARGLSNAVLSAAIPTDELVWVGSYDAGRELDTGFLSNPANEFSNSITWPYISEGRFMADEAIRTLEGFAKEGTLRDRNALARAYLYGAVTYITAADLWDQFVISNRKEAAPPIAEAEMVKLYDTAIGNLTKGLEIARATKNTNLEASLLATRARAHFAKQVWQKLNPAGSVPAQPLVASADAAADARAALALVPPDWKLQFQYGPTSIGNSLGSWINSRQEFRVDTIYGVPTKSGTKIEAVKLQDPIDKVADPALNKALTEFGAFAKSTELYPPLTVVSARELHLILAENALAQGNAAEFTQHVNNLRKLDNLTAFSGQIAAIDLLKHSRRVNLFLQGRRLIDMYRFGVKDARWIASSDAFNKPGTFFPIADEEVKSNCKIAGSC
jgi:hypothetical protein